MIIFLLKIFNKEFDNVLMIVLIKNKLIILISKVWLMLWLNLLINVWVNLGIINCVLVVNKFNVKFN